MKKKGILLAGWDEEDIKYTYNTIYSLQKSFNINTLGYNKNEYKVGELFDRKYQTILTEQLLLKEEFEYECCNYKELSASDYEQLLLITNRTQLAKLPLYKQIRYFKVLFSYYSEIFRRKKEESNGIDLIVFRNWPHLFGDYILHLAGKSLGVKSVCLYPTRGLSHFFRENENQYSGVFYTVHDIGKSEPIILPEVPEEYSKYTEEKLLGLLTLKKGTTEKSVMRNRGLNTLKSDRKLELMLVKQGREVKGVEFLTELKKNYDTISKENVEEKQNPYIYFPLPKQPEASTIPFSGENHDITIWIDQIVSALPEGLTLMCKEHPDTFRFTDIYQGHFLNNKVFPRFLDLYQILKNNMVAE